MTDTTKGIKKWYDLHPGLSQNGLFHNGCVTRLSTVIDQAARFASWCTIAAHEGYV